MIEYSFHAPHIIHLRTHPRQPPPLLLELGVVPFTIFDIRTSPRIITLFGYDAAIISEIITNHAADCIERNFVNGLSNLML